jgi:hypothetical protein
MDFECAVPKNGTRHGVGTVRYRYVPYTVKIPFPCHRTVENSRELVMRLKASTGTGTGIPSYRTVGMPASDACEKHCESSSVIRRSNGAGFP